MDAGTYSERISHLQLALDQGNESAIGQAVGMCLRSAELAMYPELAGGVYLMAGHFFLQKKQYLNARTLYQQAGQVYATAQAAGLAGAVWLQVQALLCEAQTYQRAEKTAQAITVWQRANQLASTQPDPSPLCVELALRLADAYRRDGQRRQALTHYEQALLRLEALPRPLCSRDMVLLVLKNYLPLLDTTPERHRLQSRVAPLCSLN